MQAPVATAPKSAFHFLLALLLISFLIWLTFVDDPPVTEPLTGLNDSQQMELPFEGSDGQIEPDVPEPAPLVRKRFDENRQGTCIIYALIAPEAGEYLIPGCYGKPDRWVNVEGGTILKIGRHWNSMIKSCANVESLISTVLIRRYAYDKKFPLAQIAVRSGSNIFKYTFDITIIACMENVTERACENAEKQYIQAHGGADNLLLNCCCR